MNLYQLLDESQASTILSGLEGMQWLGGRARTKELEGTVKNNLEILPSHNEDANKLLGAIGIKLIKHSAIQLNHIPLQVHPPKFSKYSGGAYYNKHTDAPWMGNTRTDLSCTLWLSDPESYEGGELCLEGEKIKGKQGQCLVYDCGLPHEVKPVTQGERICVITWLQSRIRDPRKRKLVSDFRNFLSKLEKDHKDLFLEGGAIHSSIIRMWME